MVESLGSFFVNLLNTDGFPPRWVCGSNWSPLLGWFYIAADLAIWSAYFTIPFVLALFLSRKKNVPFLKVIWLFALFIFACGTTHLLDAAMFWWPAYRLSALVYGFTGVISWLAVFALIPVVQQAMQLKTPAELEAIVQARTLELEAAKRRAEANEARFSRILDANIIGVFFCDTTERVTDSNDAFLNMVGYTRSDLDNGLINWRQMTPPEFVSQDERIVEILQQSGISGLFEKQYFHKQGHRIDVMLSVATLPEFENQCVVLALDMTQHKSNQRSLKISEAHVKALNAELEEKVEQRTAQLEEANQQMQLAYKELEAFSYSISHDLRSPLRSLDGFSTILLNDYADKLDDAGKDYLNRIRANSQKMGDLINHLLRLSQVTRAEVHKQPVNLSKLCQDFIDNFQQDNPHRITSVIIQPDVIVNADPVLMRSVVDNLLSNALKFSKDKHPAQIEFGTYRIDNKLIYFVKDNGAGFDMAHATKLFGVFQRLHSQNEYTGTGIGLATVQRIITRHGGTIWAQAEPDKGATFFFTL